MVQTEIQIAKRNKRHAGKKRMQDITNELKHYDFLRLRKIKCEIVTRSKALYYKKKLNKCRNDSSKRFGHLNILLWKNHYSYHVD